MSGSATEWAWSNSAARNGPLIVLLAIADEIDVRGKAEMSVAELARKARSSDRTVQLAARDLASLGELAVDVRAADGGRNRYRLLLVDNGRTGEESAPVKNLHPEESAPLPTIIHRPAAAEKRTKSQATPVKGEDSAPVAAVDNFGDVLDLGSVVSGGKSRSKHSPAKPPRSEPVRDDVERLCQHLADRIEANSGKRPNIGKDWRDAARLLIDKDGISEERVRAAIDWCQGDGNWWRSRIMSMTKLRDKLPVLRIQAADEQRKKTGGTRQNPDDEYAAAMQRIKARKENANGTRGDSDNRPAGQVSLPPAAN